MCKIKWKLLFFVASIIGCHAGASLFACAPKRPAEYKQAPSSPSPASNSPHSDQVQDTSHTPSPTLSRDDSLSKLLQAHTAAADVAAVRAREEERQGRSYAERGVSLPPRLQLQPRKKHHKKRKPKVVTLSDLPTVITGPTQAPFEWSAFFKGHKSNFGILLGIISLLGTIVHYLFGERSLRRRVGAGSRPYMPTRSIDPGPTSDKGVGPTTAEPEPKLDWEEIAKKLALLVVMMLLLVMLFAALFMEEEGPSPKKRRGKKKKKKKKKKKNRDKARQAHKDPIPEPKAFIIPPHQLPIPIPQSPSATMPAAEKPSPQKLADKDSAPEPQASIPPHQPPIHIPKSPPASRPAAEKPPTSSPAPDEKPPEKEEEEEKKKKFEYTAKQIIQGPTPTQSEKQDKSGKKDKQDKPPAPKQVTKPATPTADSLKERFELLIIFTSRRGSKPGKQKPSKQVIVKIAGQEQNTPAVPKGDSKKKTRVIRYLLEEALFNDPNIREHLKQYALAKYGKKGNMSEKEAKRWKEGSKTFDLKGAIPTSFLLLKPSTTIQVKSIIKAKAAAKAPIGTLKAYLKGYISGLTLNPPTSASLLISALIGFYIS